MQYQPTNAGLHHRTDLEEFESDLIYLRGRQLCAHQIGNYKSGVWALIGMFRKNHAPASEVILPPSNCRTNFCRRSDDNEMELVVHSVDMVLPPCKIKKFP